jgi:hypothetical protein
VQVVLCGDIVINTEIVENITEMKSIRSQEIEGWHEQSLGLEKKISNLKSCEI